MVKNSIQITQTEVIKTEGSISNTFQERMKRKNIEYIKTSENINFNWKWLIISLIGFLMTFLSYYGRVSTIAVLGLVFIIVGIILVIGTKKKIIEIRALNSVLEIPFEEKNFKELLKNLQ